MVTRDEAEARQRFGRRYRGTVVDAAVAAERDALGSDYGATGYTTRAQADQLLDTLALAAGDTLLDLGAGCGWPGLYLAARSGCDVVVSDLAVNGMQLGLARAARDGIKDRTSAVVSSARRLPFQRHSFDAIVHADVLC